MSHAPALSACAGDLHKLWYTFIPKPADMSAEIERRISEQAKGTLLPFTICTPAGAPVGMTTYMHIDAGSKRLEIGSTWMSKDVHRNGMNTEAKLLLLTHAFEELACIAVEFRTHRLNGQSRAAIERLGAQLDGILRAHMVMPNGTIRDTAAYSITAPEWPAIKAGLLGKINR
jgi:RimJ/RimL family protein N-acetyltransferase